MVQNDKTLQLYGSHINISILARTWLIAFFLSMCSGLKPGSSEKLACYEKNCLLK